MRFLKAAVIAFLAVTAAFSCARADDAFTITPDAGKAPLSVTVTGPQKLVDMIAACKYRVGWITPGFSIQWGDGQNDPKYFAEGKQGQSCAHVRTHQFAVPGTYTIKARMYHLGPTDAPVTDWEGETQVTVSGDTASTVPTLRIINIREGQTFSYQAMPPVEWDITTSTKVDVRAELFASDGSLIATDTKKDVAYQGRGITHLSQTGDAYNAALKGRRTPFTLVLSALDAGNVVAETKMRVQVSAEFANASRNWQIEPQTGKAPLSVALTYPYSHKACFSYRVDWGDKTVDTKEQPLQTGCMIDSGVLKLTHEYENPGSYKVIIKTNNIDPLKTINDTVYYEAADVFVTP